MKKIRAFFDSPGEPDKILFIFSSLLFLFGISMLLSASGLNSTIKGNSGFWDMIYPFLRQILYFSGGLIFAVFVYLLNPDRLRGWPLIIALLIVLVLMLAACVFGQAANEAKRWLFFFQPSEFLKPVFVLYLASNLSRNQKTGPGCLIYPMILLTIFIAVLYMQKDAGTIILLSLTAFLMMLGGRIPGKYLAGLFLVAVILSPFYLMLGLKGTGRITTWSSYIFSDWGEPLKMEDNTQVAYSIMAIGTGGMFGKGLGLSEQKIGQLTYAESDFIFSIIAEELGFAGAMLALALFSIVAWRGLVIAKSSSNEYRYLAALGLTSCLALQSFINIGMTTGILPTKGFTLPFFSNGGSSIVTTVVTISLLLALSRKPGRKSKCITV